MSKFRDSTDRPGPATWELGTYPEGRGNYPVFRLFGTPIEHKRHRLFDLGHAQPKPKNEFIREVLDWLDKYLGSVK